MNNVNVGEKKSGLGSRIKNKLKQFKRVLSVAHKPDMDEFRSSMKITGSGILFLGLIGFIIFLIYFLIQNFQSIIGA
ncbi:MAG: protein translocase SEC61 complex subunit gamma [Candidatus Aenigmarchaeota archaeon]|nr:protein translocase SEC61 complex subunit gamma [Candidatus Aenigmarchaeota archaeon]